jgi:SAM-dependent methyltransferase
MTQPEPESYWDARLRADYSLLGVGFQRLGAGFNHWQYRVRSHIYLRAIASLRLPASPRVLDVGTGTGFMIEAWSCALPEATIDACDLTAVAAEKLAHRFPRADVRKVDITRTPAPYESDHDIVSANDVLFHIEDDVGYRRAVANIHAALRPNGIFLFTEFLLHGDEVREPQEVLRSIGEVMAVLDEEGFEVLDRRPMFVLFNTPVDSDSVALRTWWSVFLRVCNRWPALGTVVGALAYLPEIALCRRLREGPSTELVICRRR